ncbi:MAG: aldehyde dehydrogenase family protein [Myxococcota bacterium]
MPDQLSITNPWNGDTVLTLELDDIAAIERKVRYAKERSQSWRKTPLAERILLVQRFIEVALEDRQDIALSITRQMGKPISEGLGEVATMVARARMMIDLAPDALADQHVALGDGIHRRIARDPLGVVVDIAAWNYPLLIAVNVVVPAILAGNTVLLKHASQTAGIGLWFEETFKRAGAPEGLVTAVTVRGRDASTLVQHPDVDGLFFTGSVEAGRQVYADVGTRPQGFIDAGFELGGKDPAYVREDMPLDIVVPNLVEGAFYNAGQSCCAVERIYVHRSRYEAFVSAYVEAAKGWVIADPEQPDTSLGALATPETIPILEAQVQDAVSRGGRLLLGGSRAEGTGWCWPATVIADANHEMSLMREESFGPIIGIMPVNDDEHAVELMNDTVFGLTASVWTADHDVGAALARRVRAGTVFVNRCDYVDPSLPWTGFGDTGKGISLSALAYDQLTKPRGVHVRPLALMR